MKKLKHVTEVCLEIYEKHGQAAVFDYVNEQKSKGHFPNVHYEYCKGCETDSPAWEHECLVCGQKTKPNKQNLVDDVIEELKKSFADGDYTVLEELLNKLSNKILVQSLPEEEWDKYKELNNSYFEVVHQDYHKDLEREEIQIHGGEKANIFLIKTDEGFIVDVYGQNDHVDSMTIWEENLEDEED